MSRFGIVDAKTRLSELVERAARGEEVIITRRGETIARLMPAQMPNPKTQAQAHASRIRASRKAQPLTPERGPELSLRELIEEGRP